MQFKGLLNVVSTFVSKHAPTILTVMGATGVVTTAVMASKATLESKDDVFDEIERRGRANYKEVALTKKEIVKLCWRNYIPTFIMGGSTIACIIGANTISTKRQLALASAYTLAEESLRDYERQVRETLGEKKAAAIRESIDKKKIEQNQPSEDKVIITGAGDCLCYDTYTGRYFKSDIEKIKRAENELNKRLLSEMFISLNEFYYAIGLDPVQAGNEMGWNVNEEGLIDVRYSSQIADYNGHEEPCLVISYIIGPRFNFGDC